MPDHRRLAPGVASDFNVLRFQDELRKGARSIPRENSL